MVKSYLLVLCRMTGLLKEERGQAQNSCVDVYSKEMEEASNAFALPLDVVEEIAKHLSVIDYLHFRATSKFFSEAAPPISRRSISSMSMSRLSLSPLLVFF